MPERDRGYDRDALITQFDKYFPRVRTRLAEAYGAAEARDIAAGTREAFEELVGRLPYIGGRRNVFTPVMVINGWIVALHRAMTARGHTVEEVVAIAYRASDDYFASFPSLVDRLLGAVATTRPVTHHLRSQARRSQERRYPADFVYTCTTTRRGGEVELELEFLECAVQKYYDAEGVPELKPFCNFFDPIYSRHFGLGVQADHTLGLGCDTCRLNYNNRRQTVLPANIQAVLDGQRHDRTGHDGTSNDRTGHDGTGHGRSSHDGGTRGE